MMPKKSGEHQHWPDDLLPDISQLVTTRLKPRPTHAREIAQHEAEIQRLVELAAVLEQAVTALVIRVQMTADLGQRDALALSRADLQRFKDEVESLRMEHQHAIERLQPQKTPMRLDRR